MRKAITVLFGILFFLSFLSCSSLRPASATQSGPRTIILDEKEFHEDEAGGFTSWYGVDFVNGGTIRVEVGFFGDQNLDGIGFILLDGGYTGELTTYRRTGLEHRWDWGLIGTGYKYSFLLKTDGTGLYYDFTSVEDGKTTTARAVYKCLKR